MRIGTKQTVDVEPDNLVVRYVAGDNKVTVEFLYLHSSSASLVYDAIVRKRRGCGLRLNVMNKAVDGV